MTTGKKSEKTDLKKTAKKASSRAVKKKSESLDLDTFTVTGSELAYIIGLPQSSINQMMHKGYISKNGEGCFNLRDSVRSYCERIRTRNDGRGKSDIDAETAIWKLQNIKMKNKEWRMQRDRFISMEILSTLASAMMTLREAVKGDAKTLAAIDKMLKAIEKTSVDDIALKVEGDEEEEEDYGA